ncbi:MAG TPA: hypothetical protein VF208_09160 [Candidatus Binatia bacterium]
MAVRSPSVFLNVPFDKQYERLYVALIAGIVALGGRPRTTLEIPPTKDRLRRIFTLIRSCDFSIHDLSRVQLSRGTPRCPRFNMPFEAGLAAASFLSGRKRNWYLLESNRFRLQKSLSDLNGYEVNIHEGTVQGILAALLDIFPYRTNHPGPTELRSVCRLLQKAAKEIKKQNQFDIFRPRAFELLRESAIEISRRTERMR